MTTLQKKRRSADIACSTPVPSGTINGPVEICEDGKLPGTTEAVFEKGHPVGADGVLILKREVHQDERVEFKAWQGGDEFLAGPIRPGGR